MDLRQLQCFVTVAERASFTRAATELHLAQPGVSAQVRRLEQELGQSLFDRSGRRVRLTAAGAALLPHARGALAEAAAARRAVDELAVLLRGRVSVGMVVACSALQMPELLAGFHEAHPAVEISLREASSDELLDGLRTGQLDLALVALTPASPPGISLQVVADERIVAAVSPGDELALGASRAIALADLRDRLLISLPPGTGLRACLDEGCRAAGIDPRIAFEANDPRMLAQLAARGLGVAILPESVARAHAASVRTLALTRPRLRGRLALAWRDGGAIQPAARALIAHVRAWRAAGSGEG